MGYERKGPMKNGIFVETQDARRGGGSRDTYGSAGTNSQQGEDKKLMPLSFCDATPGLKRAINPIGGKPAMSSFCVHSVIPKRIKRK